MSEGECLHKSGGDLVNCTIVEPVCVGCGEHRRSWEFPSLGLDRHFCHVSLHPFAKCSSCTGRTEFISLLPVI